MPRIAGLSSLKKDSSHSDDEDSSPPSTGNGGSGKPTTYYTGGASSGLAVMDPKKGGKPTPADAVDRVFKAAEAGTGTRSEAKAAVVIRFYKNGVTTEVKGVESDIRPYDSPEGIKFMAELDRGIIPTELGFKPTDEIDVTPEDHREEMYKPPPYRAFSGAGAALGGGAGKPAAAAVVKATGGAGGRSVEVDESKPTTIIQVKLTNGKRERVTLNLSHTVADLQVKVAAFGATGSKPFYLTAGFPPKPLDKPEVTIEAGGLQNASVNQVEQK